MAKSSREGWSWEPRICVYCDQRVLKTHSFGCSFKFKQIWHGECGSGPDESR
jgi:hypothetical protein